MNGLDLLKNIKSDAEISKIPVILLTNMSQKEDIDTGMGLGAKDYLIKSHFTPGEVLSKIKSVLG
jgi:DNA-binding response OmpR family regulator